MIIKTDMKRIISLLLFIVPLTLGAQGFTADRGGEVNGVEVLPKGRFQLETGVGWERQVPDETLNTWTINTTLLRFGISPHAEIRFEGRYDIENYMGKSKDGFKDVFVGVKSLIFDGWKFVPKVALIASIEIPGSKNSAFLAEDWGNEISIAFRNQITSILHLDYEFKMVWNDNTKTTPFFGVALTYALSPKVTLAAGQSNYFYRDGTGTQSWFDVTATWLVAPRLQLDFTTFFSLDEFNKYNNIQIGLAWQITKN